MKTTEQRYAFISYSTKNQEVADAMRHILMGRGFRIWMAPYDIPPGHEYGAVINQALENCGCLLLLLSGDAMGSIYVNKEVERAIAYRKTVIPVEIEKVVLTDSLKFFIGSTQIMALPDLDRDGPEFRKILAALSAVLDPGLPPPPPPPPPPSSSKCTYAELVEEFLKKATPPVANGAASLSPDFVRGAKELFRLPDDDRVLYTYRQGWAGIAVSRNPKNRFYLTSSCAIFPKCNLLGAMTSECVKLSWEEFVNASIEDTHRPGFNMLRFNGQEGYATYTNTGLKRDRDKWRYFYLDLQKYLREHKHRVGK